MFHCVQQSNMQNFVPVWCISNTTSQLLHSISTLSVLSVIANIILVINLMQQHCMSQKTQMFNIIHRCRCNSIIFKPNLPVRKHFKKVSYWHCGKVNYCGTDVTSKLLSTMWANMPVMMRGTYLYLFY